MISRRISTAERRPPPRSGMKNRLWPFQSSTSPYLHYYHRSIRWAVVAILKLLYRNGCWVCELQYITARKQAKERKQMLLYFIIFTENLKPRCSIRNSDIAIPVTTSVCFLWRRWRIYLRLNQTLRHSKTKRF